MMQTYFTQILLNDCSDYGVKLVTTENVLCVALKFIHLP